MKKTKLLNLDSREKKRLQKIKDFEEEKDHPSFQVVVACDIPLLYDEYGDVEIVAELTLLSKRSVYNYINKYIKDKNFMLKRIHPSTLEKYLDRIEEEFSLNPVSSCEEAVSRVKKLIGIQISRTQMYYFLKNQNYIKKDGFYIQNKPDFSIQIDNLLDFKEEIIEFIEANPTDSENIAINRIRKQFPLLKDTDKDIINFLKKYWVF